MSDSYWRGAGITARQSNRARGNCFRQAQETMWIEEIFIGRFGGIEQMKVGGIRPHLNVISGPNEAGKTTVAEFIRSVLFGFPKRSPRGNNYESLHGGRRSGRLLVHTGEDGPFFLSRREQPGRKVGVLLTTDMEGNPVDSAVLLELGADGEVSHGGRSLFAFDLDNLRELDREGLRSRILGTALGSVDVNPMEVLHGIDDRINRLGRRTHTDESSMFALQARLGKVEKRLRILGEKPDHYVRVQQELEGIRRRKEELGARIKRYEQDLERLRPILACEDDWNKLISLDKRISNVADASDFPADGVSRLEALSDRLREAEGNRLELENQVKLLHDRLDQLDPDPRYVEHSHAVFALSERARESAGHPAKTEGVKAGISQALKILDEEIAGLGSQWDRERVASSEPSLVVEREINGFEKSWRKLADRVDLVGTRVSEHEKSCERLREKSELKKRRIEGLARSCEGFLAPHLRSLLMEWKELDAAAGRTREQILQASRQIERLNGELRDTESRLQGLDASPRPSRSRLIAGVLVQFVAAAALIFVHSSVHFSEPVSFVVLAAGLILCATGSLSCVISLLRARENRSKRQREQTALRENQHRTAQELKTIATGREELAQDLRNAARRMAAITRTVLGNPNARRQDVLTAERVSLSAEDRVRERKALEEALAGDLSDLNEEQRITEETRQELDSARQELAALRDAWHTFLQAHGLDEDISPETALVLARRLSDLKRDLLRISEMERELASLQKEWADLVSRAHKLSADLGSPIDSAIPLLDLIARWVQSSREAAEALTARRTLLERIQECRIRLEAETGKTQELHDSIQRLMESAAVDDEESFRHKALRHQEYRTLEQERRIVADRLVTGLGLQDETEMRNLLDCEDWRSKRRTAAERQEEVQQLRSKVEELAAREGRLSSEIETLEAEDETEQLAAQREELLARLNDSIGEWTTLKLASALLTRTIRLYESEKQPKVMARASEIFRHITGGAFNRMLFPLDSETVQVERSDGSYLGEEKLSRATLEQVYLALRLAHLDVCRSDGPCLPVLMDDVLVNFDPDRAERTAALLTEFSEETEVQILFFTCHPHVEELFPAGAGRFHLEYARPEHRSETGVHAFPL